MEKLAVVTLEIVISMRSGARARGRRGDGKGGLAGGGAQGLEKRRSGRSDKLLSGIVECKSIAGC